ncbi:hypothetical protein [Streptomyces sp. NRRL S-340]|uniref:hypothetical protein n=1 Tax=Streptomyces sp. NRRL S-340 TaxID=1463901 RepID=UPI000A4197D9|nr:hypothetical protein [Streptomyces sp. NRRL S-340]
MGFTSAVFTNLCERALDLIGASQNSGRPPQVFTSAEAKTWMLGAKDMDRTVSLEVIWEVRLCVGRGTGSGVS